ncbi:MAG TPA: cell division protein SepF [Peptococcaceae bacterium]|nr:cell division protein SepF [Peptococcaceae bacterium]
MASLFDRFIGLMGFGDDEEEEDFVSEEMSEDYKGRGESKFRNLNSCESIGKDPSPTETFTREVPLRGIASKRKPASVVSIHTQKQVRVIVVEPVSFEDAQSIAEHLKARKAVILNLEQTDINISQRLVDFICGATYALGGNMQKVGNGIFLFVPNNVDISGELSYKSGDQDYLWPKMNK